MEKEEALLEELNNRLEKLEKKVFGFSGKPNKILYCPICGKESAYVSISSKHPINYKRKRYYKPPQNKAMIQSGEKDGFLITYCSEKCLNTKKKKSNIK